jgi:hypothetical protein
VSRCSLSIKSATCGFVEGRWCASSVVMAEFVDDGGMMSVLRIDCVSSLWSFGDISGCRAAWTSAWRSWGGNGACSVGPNSFEVLVLGVYRMFAAMSIKE